MTRPYGAGCTTPPPGTRSSPDTRPSPTYTGTWFRGNFPVWVSEDRVHQKANTSWPRSSRLTAVPDDDSRLSFRGNISRGAARAGHRVQPRRPGGTQTVTELGRTLMLSFLVAGRAPPSSSKRTF